MQYGNPNIASNIVHDSGYNLYKAFVTSTFKTNEVEHTGLIRFNTNDNLFDFDKFERTSVQYSHYAAPFISKATEQEIVGLMYKRTRLTTPSPTYEDKDMVLVRETPNGELVFLKF